jgi:hypothetical protein
MEDNLMQNETVIELGLFTVCVALFIIFIAVAGGCTSVPQTGERTWHEPIEKGVE